MCRTCGTSEQLTFDHIDRTTKLFEISVGIRDGFSRERLAIELSKCQLLCWPHHRAKSKEYGDIVSGGWNRIANPQHGTGVRYANQCRCVRCRQWKQLYRNGVVDARGGLRAA